MRRALSVNCADPIATHRGGSAARRIGGPLLCGLAILAGPVLHAAAPAPAVPAEAEKDTSKALFDGKTLKGWKPADFYSQGEIAVENGELVIGAGQGGSGVTWTNEFPSTNYEVSLEAMRVDGSDFFCGMTFRVGEAPCTLILGGWGGGVVGLSSIDGLDASENSTSQYIRFENKKWYSVRLRVTDAAIRVWLDDRKIIDQARAGHKISIRWEMDPCRPFGLATWYTKAALRNIRLRALTAEEAAEPKPGRPAGSG